MPIWAEGPNLYGEGSFGSLNSCLPDPLVGSRRFAFPLLGLAFLSLVLGIWAGLVHVGWPWPSLTQDFWLAHGPLMVSGFVGTLIAVERAVAIGRSWGYAAPALTAAGALVLLVAVPLWVGPFLIVLGSAVLAALFAVILVRQPTLRRPRRCSGPRHGSWGTSCGSRPTPISMWMP